MNIFFVFLSVVGALAFWDGPGFWIFLVIGITNGIGFFCPEGREPQEGIDDIG